METNKNARIEQLVLNRVGERPSPRVLEIVPDARGLRDGRDDVEVTAARKRHFFYRRSLTSLWTRLG